MKIFATAFAAALILLGLSANTAAAAATVPSLKGTVDEGAAATAAALGAAIPLKGAELSGRSSLREGRRLKTGAPRRVRGSPGDRCPYEDIGTTAGDCRDYGLDCYCTWEGFHGSCQPYWLSWLNRNSNEYGRCVYFHYLRGQCQDSRNRYYQVIPNSRISMTGNGAACAAHCSRIRNRQSMRGNFIGYQFSHGGGSHRTCECLQQSGGGYGWGPVDHADRNTNWSCMKDANPRELGGTEPGQAGSDEKHNKSVE